jgi:uncharacterized protein with PQ loop repeat
MTLTKIYEKYMICMGSFGHFLFIFQTIKIIQTQSSYDVSLIGFFVSFISLVSWLIYGILKGDSVLILVNIFGSVSAFFCICAILYFR